MKHTKIKAAVVAADPYQLACSIRKRTGCSMKEARARARAIKRLALPRLSPAEIAQLTRSTYKGNP
jgi:hypothetical protein